MMKQAQTESTVLDAMSLFRGKLRPGTCRKHAYNWRRVSDSVTRGGAVGAQSKE